MPMFAEYDYARSLSLPTSGPGLKLNPSMYAQQIEVTVYHLVRVLDVDEFNKKMYLWVIQLKRHPNLKRKKKCINIILSIKSEKEKKIPSQIKHKLSHHNENDSKTPPNESEDTSFKNRPDRKKKGTKVKIKSVNPAIKHPDNK